MTFVASRLEMIEGSPTYVPHESSDELSVSNSSGFRLLALMGVRDADYSGAMTLDEASAGVARAWGSGSITNRERRQTVVIDEIVQQGRLVGATHLSWA
jgi:hypothetical protein